MEVVCEKYIRRRGVGVVGVGGAWDHSR